MSHQIEENGIKIGTLGFCAFVNDQQSLRETNW